VRVFLIILGVAIVLLALSRIIGRMLPPRNGDDGPDHP